MTIEKMRDELENRICDYHHAKLLGQSAAMQLAVNTVNEYVEYEKSTGKQENQILSDALNQDVEELIKQIHKNRGEI